MKRQSILVITVVSLFMLAWWAGYSFLGDLDFGKTQAKPKTPTASASKSTGRQRNKPKNAVNVQSKDLTRGVQFSNTGWNIDESRKQPRACLTFSQAINSADNLKIKDYIRVEPSTKFTTEISGQSVCVAGLAFSKEYTLTMLEGLPSVKGETLAEDQSLQISFGDRPPYVGFVGDGVILPRIGAQGLAIETTNIDKLDIQVFRVGERMLARRRPDAGESIKEGRYYYGYDNVGSEVREEVWTGALPIDGLPNTMTTTIFPFSDVVGALKPGAYIVEAMRQPGDDDDVEGYDYRPARAWRWIISTDLAFTTYQSPSGLDATVRSIDSGKSMRGVKVELVADNNEILGTSTTDGTGRVHFDAQLVKGTGTLRPRMLMAYGADGDYALLDFNRSPLDLSAFAIGGRHAGKDIDAYVFADRGVYRPGETANITAMLRDPKARAIEEGRAGQIRYMKPNYQEFRKVRFEAGAAGTVLQAFEIPRSAPRGVWNALIEIDGLGQVGSASFSVEDFVPQTLKVDIKMDEAPVRGDESRSFDISSMFLYGAVGADLAAEAEARIRVDPAPFPALKGYRFGLATKSFSEVFVDMGGGVTDAKGILQMDLDIKGQGIETMSPLRAEITAGVSEPSGRYVKNSLRVPVRTNDSYIGIKAKFSNRPKRDKPAGFNVRAVDWQGNPQAKKAVWLMVKETNHYNWYRKNGRWQYRNDQKYVEVARGDLDINAEEGADVTETLGWGRYLLTVKTEDGISASYRFYVGWGGGALTNAPDQIQLGASKDLVRSGDMVKLTINSPYAGTGELVIADQAVRHIQSVNISKGISEVSVRMPKDIGSGVYALLSVYTERSADDRPIPRRAVGIAYMKADTGQQTLGVTVGAPEVVKPRQTQKINVRFDNVPRGEKVYLTLAAIDEGVLQITKYKSPDPAKFYFSRKAMPITVRDDYVRLLNPNLGAPTMARSGGDSLGGEGLTTAPIKVVSLYSGLVNVKNNKTSIEVELPDFNGKLRLMAVAWSRSAVGSDVKPMIVRDAVPALIGLPRFLAPGDKAIASISLDNVGGKAGNYSVALTGDGNLNIPSISEKLNLAKGQRESTLRDILAATTGVSTISLTVKGPGGYKVNSEYDIQTRSPFMPVSKLVTKQMAAGETTKIDRAILQGYDPGSVDIDVSFSRTPGLDPTAYAAALTRYPYGCSEQITSAALPLLYAKELGGAPNLAEHEVKFAMQRSVDTLSNRQGTDGSFGLWKAGDGYARPWLGVYVTDFLYRAEENGSDVSEETLDKTTKALVNFTKMPKYPSLNYLWKYEIDTIERRLSRQAETAAYAHYVLARNGNGKLSSLRYFSDNHAKKLRSALSWGHLGAALSMMGDERRADQAFKKSMSLLNETSDYDFYQSPIRDAAGVLALVKETEQDEYVEATFAAFQKRLSQSQPRYLNTQAQAHIIMAIRALLKDSEPVDISAKGAKVTTIGAVAKSHLYGPDVEAGASFTNDSAKSIWRSVSIVGTPKEAPLPVSKGYEVTKRVLTLEGKTVNLQDMKQGERYIVHIAIRHAKKRSGLSVLADLLPAGLEIETIIPYNDAAYPFLKGKLDSFQTAEMRDDRLVAATRTYYHKSRTYDIAYLVRAVTPGEFIWPGAVVEDMYRAQEHAITAAKRIKISTGQEG